MNPDPHLTLSREMIEQAVQGDHENRLAQIRAENDAMDRFWSQIPEHLRDDDEINQLAAIVAFSQRNPLHPDQARAVRDQLAEILRRKGL